MPMFYVCSRLIRWPSLTEQEPNYALIKVFHIAGPGLNRTDTFQPLCAGMYFGTSRIRSQRSGP